MHDEDIRVGIGGRAGEGLDGRNVDSDNEVRLSVEEAAGAKARGVESSCRRINSVGLEVGVQKPDKTHHHHPTWRGSERSQRWQQRGQR